MWTYLVRRLLLMIPTLFGISLINFGLINAADVSHTSTISTEGSMDASASVEAGEADRILRATFNLDKPVFFNTRFGLQDAEILWRLATPLRTYSLPAEKVADRDTLDDYGRAIVPHLVRIAAADLTRYEADYAERWADARKTWLTSDKPVGEVAWPPPPQPPPFDGDFRTRLRRLALDRLYANAPRRARVRYGGEQSAEDRAYNKQVREEQRELRTFFEEKDPARAIALWTAWYERNRAEWDYSFGDKVSMLLLETRFAKYWARLLTFDLGESFDYRRPVSELIFERLHVSLTLSFGALLLAYLIAVPLGILSAATHRSRSDAVISFVLFALYSLPAMFLGVLLRNHLGTDMGIFPVAGFESADHDRMTILEQVKDVLHHLALPLATMTLGSLAFYSRYMKAGLIEMIGQDFIRTARAKGLPEFVVVMKHGVRNSLIPIVTLLGASLPALVGGSIIVETIFGIDGMGRFAWEAFGRRDYTIILGVNMIAAILTMVGVFLTDLFYAAIDPRIRYT